MILDPVEAKQLRVCAESPFFWDYLIRHPYLLIPCGFDELRFDESTPPRLDPELIGVDQRRLERMEYPPPYRFDRVKLIGVRSSGTWNIFWENARICALRLRRISSGAWYRIAAWPHSNSGGHYRYELELVPVLRPDPEAKIALTGDEIVSACSKSGLLQFPASLVLPGIWTPGVREIKLVDSVHGILEQVRNEQVSLRQLPWQLLEEVVAELLHKKGLEVRVTKRSKDGGRDIIARGELIPGEPVTLAVEVKQKDVVGVDDVRRVAYANRHFPLVMLATAGRFSAGVVQEKSQPDLFLRLLLKDGVALKHWVESCHVDFW